MESQSLKNSSNLNSIKEVFNIVSPKTLYLLYVRRHTVALPLYGYTLTRITGDTVIA